MTACTANIWVGHDSIRSCLVSVVLSFVARGPNRKSEGMLGAHIVFVQGPQYSGEVQVQRDTQIDTFQKKSWPTKAERQSFSSGSAW